MDSDISAKPRGGRVVVHDGLELERVSNVPGKPVDDADGRGGRTYLKIALRRSGGCAGSAC